MGLGSEVDARVLLDILSATSGVEKALSDLLEILHARLIHPDLYDEKLPTAEGLVEPATDPQAKGEIRPATWPPGPTPGPGAMTGRFAWYHGWTPGHAVAMARLRAVLDTVPDEAIPALFEGCLELRFSAVGRQGQEYASPSWMSALQMALLDPEGATVDDPVCGFGGSLLAAARAGATSVSGADLNPWAVEVTAMRLAVHGYRCQTRLADSLANTVPGVDRIVMDPPLGIRLSTEQVARWGGRIQSHDDAGAWLTVAADALAQGGIAAVLVGAARLGSSKVFTEMVGSGLVEAVIMLPGGALISSSIRTCIVTLHRRTDPPPGILVVDLGTYFDGDRGFAALLPEGIENTRGLLLDWRAGQAIGAPQHLALTIERSGIVAHGFLPRFAAAPERPTVIPEPAARLLTELRIRDVKSLRGSHRVPLAPLTLVYGPNSAGKSSVIQSLLLLAQSASAGQFVAKGSLADLGSFVSLVSEHDMHRSIGVGVDFGIVSPWPASGGSVHPSFVRQVDVAFGTHGGTVAFPAEASVGVSGLRPLRATRNAPDRPWIIDVATLDSWAELLADPDRAFLDPRRRRTGPGGTPAALARALKVLQRLPDVEVTAEPGSIVPRGVSMPETTLGSIDPKDQLERRLSQAMRGIDSELERLAEAIIYLGPIRPAPERFSTRTSDGRIPSHAGYLYDNDSAVGEVNSWLKKLGIPYSMQVLALTVGGSNASIGDLVAMVLQDLRSGVEVSPADVGYGISQVLPIVVECLRNSETLICVEQPELHLHPRLQANLAELMVEATARSGAGNQIIAETHSEHMLLRLQRLVREQALDPADVAIIYVDQDASGQVDLQRLRLGPDGQFLDPWPTGFFDDTLDDVLGGWT